ncbi:MAG: DUF748 domain-containing protein [Pseudomonadales bacterium]
MKIDRKWWYAATGIVLYAAAGFLLAPRLVERALVSTLDERLELDTTLESLAINPFTLTLTADGLDVRERNGSPILAFERLFVNFELVSLFRWAVSFDEAHLIRPSIHLERASDTENSVSRLAETWTRTAAPSDPMPATEAEATPGEPFRLTVADLRVVEGRVSVTDHTRTDTFSTEFGPINLAVTDLSTLPDDTGSQQVTIHTESGAELAWTGSLSVNPLAISGAVTARGAHAPLAFRYFRDELKLPIGIEGGEIEARLNYALSLDDAGALSVRVDNLEGAITGVTITQPDHPPLLTLGAFSVRGGRFAWPERAVHVDDIQFADVRIDAYRAADGSYLPLPTDTVPPAATEPMAEAEAAVEPTTGVDATPGAPDVPAGWSLSTGTLRLAGWALSHTDTTLSEGTVAISDLNLTLSDLSNTPGQVMPLAVTLTPAAGGRITVDGSLTALPAVTLSAELTAEQIPLAIAQPYVDTVVHVGIGDGQLSLTGRVTSNESEPALYEGDFKIENLTLTDRVQDERLLAWKQLAVDRLKVRPASVELSSLTLDAPYARVEIEQGGRSNLDQLAVIEPAAAEAADPPPAASPAPAQEDAEAAPSPPFVLSIGETRITDGSAHFEDLNLPLPFQADITRLNGSLSTLASNSNAPSRVAIEGQVNEYGRLKIAGNLQPFSPIRGTDVTVAFNNVEMPRMSPYTIKFAGRRIADGRTDLTLTYKVVEGHLEGDNHLVIRDLRLGDKVPHPDAMDLPLDLAVALLKDPSGVVDFNFPVSGSIDDPQFSYSGAIMKAFSNVILGLATAPFKLLGALVGVSPSEFEHIAFEAGRSDLTPPQREVLAKLADALTQRPQLGLALTPVWDPDADGRALAEAALEAALEARLAADGAQEAMIGERRLKQLEVLYDEAALTPDRAALKIESSPPDAKGSPTFDPLLYTERLRGALIEAQPVTETDLTTLANRRVDSVRQALIAEVTLTPERLTTRPAEREKADRDDQIRMPLEVSAGGTSGGS